MRAIVNVGVGLWYPIGSKRLHQSIIKYSPNTAVFINQIPHTSHKDNPYAFKIAAIQQAYDKGCRKIFWMDSSVYLRKSMKPLWDLLDTQGHVLIRNGFNCGQWCSDAALKILGLDREDAFIMPDYTGAVMGLNFEYERTREFFSKLQDACAKGCFKGSWSNQNGDVSEDTRVLGHRHDQVIGSIIADRLGMELINPSPYFVYRNGDEMNVKEDVILVSQGMLWDGWYVKDKKQSLI